MAKKKGRLGLVDALRGNQDERPNDVSTQQGVRCRDRSTFPLHGRGADLDPSYRRETVQRPRAQACAREEGAAPSTGQGRSMTVAAEEMNDEESDLCLSCL
jgi:hypothetical protein